MNMNEKNKIENCRIEPKLKLINMDSVEVEQVEWLLYPFIPYGKVTIIQGDPGEGKTRRMLVRCSRELTGVEENFQKGALIQGAPAETVDERRLAQ